MTEARTVRVVIRADTTAFTDALEQLAAKWIRFLRVAGSAARRKNMRQAYRLKRGKQW